MSLEFTPIEKRFLHSLGRREEGRELIALFERAKAYYASNDTIDMSRNTRAQLEGRVVFKSFVDDFIREIETKERPKKKIEVEDYSS